MYGTGGPPCSDGLLTSESSEYEVQTSSDSDEFEQESEQTGQGNTQRAYNVTQSRSPDSSQSPTTQTPTTKQGRRVTSGNSINPTTPCATTPQRPLELRGLRGGLSDFRERHSMLIQHNRDAPSTLEIASAPSTDTNGTPNRRRSAPGALVRTGNRGRAPLLTLQGMQGYGVPSGTMPTQTEPGVTCDSYKKGTPK